MVKGKSNDFLKYNGIGELFDLEFLLVSYDDLRSDHFETRSKIKRLILAVKIKHVKGIIDKVIQIGEPLPY